MADENPQETEAVDATEAAGDAIDDAARAAAAVEQAVTDGPLELPDFDADAHGNVTSIDLLSDVNLRVQVELGRTKMLVEDVLRIDRGSVVELDKPAGDPVDVYVNDRLVARGEVIVVNETFCVRVSEIVHAVDSED